MKKTNILLTIIIISYLITPFMRVKGSDFSINETIYLYHEPTTTTTNTVQYSLHVLNKGIKISWEFRTYNNPFSVSFYCDSKLYSSGADYGFGTIEILQYVNLMVFKFINMDDSNDGWIDIELKKSIDLIYGYNFCLMVSLIGVVVIYAIIKNLVKKK